MPSMRHETSQTRMGVRAAAIIGTAFGLAVATGPLASAAVAAERASAGPTVQAVTSAFVSGTEDLPLMAGLREVPDRGVVFESPNGRIVEAWAVGYLAPERVRAFYNESLPQLGWQAAGDMRFRREGEVLTLDVLAGSADPLAVRFRIAPGS